MSWLALQIWIELLVAAAIGGVAVWAYLRWRPSFGVLAPKAPVVSAAASGVTDPEGRVRIAELESQLRVERDEVEALRRKAAAVPVSAAPVAEPAATPQEAPADGEGSLAWRNRYLEARVRFLEGKLAEVEASIAPETPPEDQNDEATRLRWRNRYLEGRVKYLEEELLSGGTLQIAMPPEPPANSPAGKAPPANAEQPDMLDAPRNGRADDLKAISGIGPKLERLLNSLGVYHYEQIASWTPAHVDWVNAAISFRGRIERERWVAQAAQLVQGSDASGTFKFGDDA
jgi:predicted flap endonuclease-1-like 5' DNA nuclease